MRLVGGIIVLGVSLFVYALYNRFLAEGRGLARAYLSLMKRIREQIFCYSKGVKEIISEVSDEGLEAFVSMVKEGRRAHEAFALSDTGTLLKEEKELIAECLESLGTGYLESEVKRLDVYIKRLEELISANEAESAKKKKVLLAALLAVSLGVIILIM